MRTKITKTLLDSWAYTFDCYEGGEEEAWADFLRTLKREPSVENEAMAAGHRFEDYCYRMANGEIFTADTEYYEGAKKIASIITDGQFQVPVSCNLTVGGKDFWLYGICDVVKAGIIYDVKFKTKSLGSIDLYGSYRYSSQHSAYLRAMPEAMKFIYLASDGRDLYAEEYTQENARPIEECIAEFMGWLNTKPELLKIYNERWAVE